MGIYLAGSCLVNPALRGLVLAGVLCSMEVVVLMQSRGAMVATAVSLPVFLVFLSSGQRLRSLLSPLPPWSLPCSLPLQGSTTFTWNL